jgi:AraC-like DNA-binding protein
MHVRMSGLVQSYVERPAPAALRGVVASTWVQRVEVGALVHRDLPSGCVELRCRVGGVPEVVGPLTRARVEVLEAGTTVVGVRLHPAAAARVLLMPASEFVDQVVSANDVWPGCGSRLAEQFAVAAMPNAGVEALLQRVAASLAGTSGDPLVAAAVRRLRWHADDVGLVARELHVSERELRRRMRAQVGLAPKALQRALRFQRFLALAQYAMARGRAASDDGLARLAADAGFADQAHLSRECVRLTGQTPSAFLGSAQETCACGHDHAAAYVPVLRARGLLSRAA